MQGKQLGDFFQTEAQLLRPADEAQSFEIALDVAAIASNRARWFIQNALTLVEADGLNIYSGLRSKFADCHSNIVNFSVLWSPERTAVEAVPASFFSTFVTLGHAPEDGILNSILPLLSPNTGATGHCKDDCHDDDVSAIRNPE